MKSIVSREDLVALHKSGHRRRFSKEEYQFIVPELSAVENASLTKMINHYSTACGCGAGSLFLSGGIVLMTVHYFASGGRLTSITLRSLLWFLLIASAFAMSGKFLGLLWARWKIIRVLSAAIREISSRAVVT
jgi:hypothetical protein